jgi:hypothetical protein
MGMASFLSSVPSSVVIGYIVSFGQHRTYRPIGPFAKYSTYLLLFIRNCLLVFQVVL